MPESTQSAARADDRDQFRAAVTALPAGPLRDVLVAVAYARDAAARTGATAAPDDRWRALVAAAERAVRDAALGAAVDAVLDPALAPTPSAGRRRLVAV